uniref:No apical meristem-associated C-terminal domain-containing protein n=1 Tax=Brassica oleracea var. oleracea TaxID=109376 RepID=A0A0D3A978_BRAOL
MKAHKKRLLCTRVIISTLSLALHRIFLSLSLVSPRRLRRHLVTAFLAVESSFLSLSSTPPSISRSPRRLLVSLDRVDASASLSQSPRRLLVSLDLVDASASLWLSSTALLDGSPRRNQIQRIARYFNASPKLAGCEKREATHCKQRWHKMNDLLCKFCGAYEAATREKSSGQNENDGLKLAHEIFFNNHKKKFTLEHAWKELRNDQKWCDLSTARHDGSSKKRKSEEGSQSASSKGNETDSALDDEGTIRPPGVKAAKGRGKKPVELSDFKTVWSIKKQVLDMKERLSKIKLLDSLIGKQGPLADYEEALKKKLVDELMSH